LNITLSVSGETEEVVKKNRHIKWTEIAREAIADAAERQKKLLVLESYLDKKPISKKDWEWMEKNDWHPADEMELKQDFIEKMSNKKKQKIRKISSLDELK
jgi:hypothetical protein